MSDWLKVIKRRHDAYALIIDDDPDNEESIPTTVLMGESDMQMLKRAVLRALGEEA